MTNDENDAQPTLFDHINYIERDQVYTDKTFSKWSVKNDDLSRTEFIKCKIEHCVSQQLNLTGGTFEDCTFLGCNFSNANINGTRFIDCSFTECKIIGWHWHRSGSPLSIRLTRCNCSESNFFGVSMKKLSLTECLFANCDFGDAKLTNADLSGSDFAGARFANTDLAHADFRGSTSYAIDVRSNIIKKARFSLPEAVSLLNSLNIIVE